MKKVKKMGFAVLAVLFSLSCTTTVGSRILASGSWDKTIKLWDVSDPENINRKPLKNKPLKILKEHKKLGAPIAFSPDGNLLASGSWDKTIKLWDVTSPEKAKELKTSMKHKSNVNSIAFSPDGNLLASGSNEGFIELWDVTSPEKAKELKTPMKHKKNVNSIAFSPDGNLFASASFDTIKLWDVSDPKNINKLRTLTGYDVTSIAFSPDGNQFAAGSFVTIKRWNVSDPKNINKLKTLKGHKSNVNAIAFSPDSNLLASGSNDEYIIKLWDVRDPKKAKELKTLSGSVRSLRFEDYLSMHSVVFSPDGNLLASGSNEGFIELWDISDLEKPRRLNVIHGHAWGKRVYSLAFRPEPKKLLHLKDPDLQEEKIKLMRSLQLRVPTFKRETYPGLGVKGLMERVDPMIKEKIKNIKTDIERLYLRSLYYTPKKLTKWYEDIKLNIENIKFRINLKPLKEKLEYEYKEGLKRIKQRKEQ